MTAFNIALGAEQWRGVQQNIKLGFELFYDVDKMAEAFQTACKSKAAPPPDAPASVTVEMNTGEALVVIRALTAECPIHPSHHHNMHSDLFTGGMELTVNQERIRDNLETDYQLENEVYERRRDLALNFLSMSVTHVNGKPFTVDAEERASIADGFADKIGGMEAIVAQEHRDAETVEATKLKLRAQKIADEAKRTAEADEAARSAATLADTLLCTVLDLADLDDMPAMQWLVDRLYPAGGLNFLAGAPKTGKSFAAISLGLHIAAGKPWHRLPVQQGAVVYVCAEGSAGIGKRVAAARREYDIPASAPFYVFRPLRLADAGEVAVFIEMVRRKVNGQPVALVIFDTLSRMIPGLDENSAGSMSPVVHNLTAVAESLACATITVHHTGQNAGKGMRGSTVLTGAADSVVLLHGRDGGVGPGKLVCSHLKDGAAGGEVMVTFAVVNEGEYGETLVMRDRALSPKKAPPPASGEAVAGEATEPDADGGEAWDGPTDGAGWLVGLDTLLAETGQQGATGDEWFNSMFPDDAADREGWRHRWRGAVGRMEKSRKLRRDGALFVPVA